MLTRNMPNTWFAVARVLIDYLVIISVFVNPFRSWLFLGGESRWQQVAASGFG